LEVSAKATDSQVKQAFLKLAKVFHPDVNKAPGAKEKFAEILEAYDILSDESKREIYDKSGLTAAQQEDMEYEESINKLERGEYEHATEFSSDEDEVIDHEDKNLTELIDRISEKLGPNKKGIESIYDRSNQNEHSFPIVEEITLSLAEYVKGCNKNILYRKNIICPDCKGIFCQ
jgi:DnaJ-class molecular chaperone